jgi:23S rRNA (adenine2503-C2)-methyltransferase
MEQKVLPNIRHLTGDELTEWLRAAGEPSFRSRQIGEWLWKKRVRSFDKMTNLSKELRQKLADNFAFPAAKIRQSQKSTDGTIKFAFELEGGHIVEGVLIPSPTEERMTACISSQVGCSLSCSFCATGTMDLARNVSFEEIYDQVTLIEETALREYGRELTNIVFMGMGEPLLNYKNVTGCIHKLTSPEARGMSPRRITVSTVGIVKMMYKLADDDTGVNLALSLHAAKNAKRSSIMEINTSNPLWDLKAALQYYSEKSGSMVFLEYIMLGDLNTNEEDVEALAAFCKDLHCKINLIEFNPVSHADYKRVSSNQAHWFQQKLEAKGLRSTIRRSRGMDIDAACGQLALK